MSLKKTPLMNTMESLEEQLRELALLNSKPPPPKKSQTGKVAEMIDNLQQKSTNPPPQTLTAANRKAPPPCIPPKPHKKSGEQPQVPLSRVVTCSREPLYSRPLHGLDKTTTAAEATGSSMLLRKHPIYATHSAEAASNSKSTLDNPVVLEQQLEALAYHKLQMERRGLLMKPLASAPKLSSNSLSSSAGSIIYSNLRKSPESVYGYMSAQPGSGNSTNTVYSNVQHTDSHPHSFAAHSPSLGGGGGDSRLLSICTNSLSDKDIEDDLPPPPSPVSAVSSSYSELRRATEVFCNKPLEVEKSTLSRQNHLDNKNYANQSYNTYNNATLKIHQSKNNAAADYYGYGGMSQSSSTYDSIYEPINPRPPGNYNLYVNEASIPGHGSSSSGPNVPVYISGGALTPSDCDNEHMNYPSQMNRAEGNNLNQYVTASSLDSGQDCENYGRCVKCQDRVLGENSGCTAMDQIYHIACFTCTDCQINLQGKPFYALEGKPYCEYDYLQTLEKCSVCMKPILERILRATGKPYHPQCFTCVVCGKSLDGLLFTVDATNQNYCITDFHKKFAPRCCVCKEPIMPELGQEETVRVVALDRSFHLECYKCEDCGLLLSSEADGRGCYPLDDHILCKSCNAQRVQVLTNRMTSEL